MNFYSAQHNEKGCVSCSSCWWSRLHPCSLKSGWPNFFHFCLMRPLLAGPFSKAVSSLSLPGPETTWLAALPASFSSSRPSALCFHLPSNTPGSYNRAPSREVVNQASPTPTRLLPLFMFSINEFSINLQVCVSIKRIQIVFNSFKWMIWKNFASILC